MEIIKTSLEEKEKAIILIEKASEYWKITYGEPEYSTAIDLMTNTLNLVRNKISENEGQEQSWYRALQLFMESNIIEYPDRKREIVAIGIICTLNKGGLTEQLIDLANKELIEYETATAVPLPEINTTIEVDKQQ